MSGSSHPYPTGFPSSQQQASLLGNQFNSSPVPSMSGPISSGMQFNLGPSPQVSSQVSSGGGQVNSNVNSQVNGVVSNTNGVDPMSVSQNANGVVSRTSSGGNPGDGSSQGAQTSRDINTASLCRIGQETVQDIVSRTQEIFQTLKTIQAPNGTIPGSNASNDKKNKIQEQLRTIKILFKRLRLIYEKCNENTQLQGMEYTHIESLIPIKDEWDIKSEERKNSEVYRQTSEECKELVEQVVLKNKHLKEIVDHLRRIIWEINTMLAMRRS